MAKLNVEVHEGVGTDDSVEQSTAPIDLAKFKVLSEFGIFKHGKQHDQGEVVEMDRATGLRFVEAGEAELVED